MSKAWSALGLDPGLEGGLVHRAAGHPGLDVRSLVRADRHDRGLKAVMSAGWAAG